MNDLFSIKNKVFVITGAGRGIGNFLATELSKRSAIIHGVDKTFETKNNFFTHNCDITNKSKLQKISQKIIKDNTVIDVLINNAGVTFPNPSSDDYSLKDWQETLNVNLTGAFVCSQVIGNIMKQQKSGSIINITSINAELGFPNNPAYVASKGGLKMLTKSLAKDLGKYGIRVNNLGPGYIHTDMTKKSFENKKTRKSRQEHTLLNRWGNPSDLLGPCIFLATNSSSYVTGQDLYVDGGWLSNGLIK